MEVYFFLAILCFSNFIARSTYQTPLRNTDPGCARDQRYPAIKNKARCRAGSRISSGEETRIPSQFFCAPESRVWILGTYWRAISSNERKFVNGYAKFLVAFDGNEGALLDAAEQYLEQVASHQPV